jgi:hypothetical protein
MPTGSTQVLQARSQAALTPAMVGAGTTSVVQVPVDYRTAPFTIEAAADGTAQVVVKGAPAGQNLFIERISIHTDSTQASQCGAYVGTVSPENRMDYSPEGNDDLADEANPILVPGGQDFIIAWTGLSAGATVYARVQWRRTIPVSASVGG